MRTQRPKLGLMVEEIEWFDRSRHGCTMAPTLVNIYASVVAEWSLSRVEFSYGCGYCSCQ